MKRKALFVVNKHWENVAREIHLAWLVTNNYDVEFAQTKEVAENLLKQSTYDAIIVNKDLIPLKDSELCFHNDGFGKLLLKNLKCNYYNKLAKILVFHNENNDIYSTNTILSGIGQKYFYPCDLDDIVEFRIESEDLLGIINFAVENRIKMASASNINGGNLMEWLTTLKTAADIATSTQNLAGCGKKIYDWFNTLIYQSKDEVAIDTWEQYYRNPTPDNKAALIETIKSLYPEVQTDSILESYLIGLAKEKIDNNNTYIMEILEKNYGANDIDRICRRVPDSTDELPERPSKIDKCKWLLDYVRNNEDRKEKLIKKMLEVNPSIIGRIVKGT